MNCSTRLLRSLTITLLTTLSACNGFPSIGGPPVRYYAEKENEILFQAVIPALDAQYTAQQRSVSLDFEMISGNLERIFATQSIREIYEYWQSKGVVCREALDSDGAAISCRVEHHWREDYPGSGARCLGPDNNPNKTHEPPCEASLRLFHRFSREHGVLTVRTSTRAADVSLELSK